MARKPVRLWFDEDIWEEIWCQGYDRPSMQAYKMILQWSYLQPYIQKQVDREAKELIENWGQDEVLETV